MTIKSKGRLPDISKAERLILYKATTKIQTMARSNAPYDTGSLRRSIMTKVSKSRGRVGTNLPYAKMREYGGVILPKRKKMLAWGGKNGKWIFAKKVRQKGKPYLIPAYEKVLANMGNLIRSEIEKTTK